MAAYLIHQVTQADSLRGLAARYLKDHREWVTLVSYNELLPEQYELWAAGVRELRIPITLGPGEDTTSPYLSDLAVDADGGLVLAPSGGLAVVAGVPNVITSLVRALTTDLGSLLPHQQYGMDLDRYVATAGTSYFLQLLKGEVKRVILRDPRVAGVEKLRVVQQPGLRRIEVGGMIRLIGNPDTFEFYVERDVA